MDDKSPAYLWAKDREAERKASRERAYEALERIKEQGLKHEYECLKEFILARCG